jgi:hypothetical protein
MLKIRSEDNIICIAYGLIQSYYLHLNILLMESFLTLVYYILVVILNKLYG